MVRNRFFVELPGMRPLAQAGDETASCLAQVASVAQELPLANCSVDAVMLHHLLEVVEDPRQVLREACRVLTPGGRLILCGFNPFSAWGAGNLGRWLKYGAISRVKVGHGASLPLRFVRLGRLLDWLDVLGFEHQQPVERLDYSISGSSQLLSLRNWLQLRQLPIANAYMMCMTKVTSARTPMSLSGNLGNRRLASVNYPKLAAWEKRDSRS